MNDSVSPSANDELSGFHLSRRGLLTTMGVVALQATLSRFAEAGTFGIEPASP